MESADSKAKRRRLLKLAQSIEGVRFGSGESYEGELLVGCRHGVSTIRPYKKLCDPKGGFRLCHASLDRLGDITTRGLEAVEEAKRFWDDWRDDFEPKFADAVAMTMADCKPDTEYFRLALEPMSLGDIVEGRALGKYLFYSVSEEELRQKWNEFLAEVCEHPEMRWEHMDTDELENWLSSEFPELFESSE
jgi:hypothetical protein